MNLASASGCILHNLQGLLGAFNDGYRPDIRIASSDLDRDRVILRRGFPPSFNNNDLENNNAHEATPYFNSSIMVRSSRPLPSLIYIKRLEAGGRSSHWNARHDVHPHRSSRLARVLVMRLHFATVNNDIRKETQ